jgi:hypothetical protein
MLMFLMIALLEYYNTWGEKTLTMQSKAIYWRTSAIDKQYGTMNTYYQEGKLTLLREREEMIRYHRLWHI